jgi:hypothetical protein
MANEVKSMNTLQIMLDLNKKLFAANPEKLSDNDRLLRAFTLMDCKAAHLGTNIRKLPNVFRDQEKAETVINKFRAAKTPEAITAFNLFVDEIQEPSNRSAKYTEQLTALQKAFRDYVKDIQHTMTDLLPKSMADSRTGPYIAELKAKETSFKPMVSTMEALSRDGSRIAASFDKLTDKARINLASVAPDVAMADKRAERRGEQPDSPSNLGIE